MQIVLTIFNSKSAISIRSIAIAILVMNIIIYAISRIVPIEIAMIGIINLIIVSILVGIIGIEHIITSRSS